MSKLSTHILDTAAGIPAKGVKVSLAKWQNDKFVTVKTLLTNDDGRTDELLLDANEMEIGKYEIKFHIGSYFSENSEDSDQLRFLDIVPIWFAITDANQNYHVPLLVSPWSYSTYRGS